MIAHKKLEKGPKKNNKNIRNFWFMATFVIAVIHFVKGLRFTRLHVEQMTVLTQTWPKSNFSTNTKHLMMVSDKECID